MSTNEMFLITLTLWGGVAGLFVLAGFLTGEWTERFRELRESISERRGDRTLAGNQPLPRTS